MNTIVGNNKQRSADRVYTVLTTYRCVYQEHMSAPNTALQLPFGPDPTELTKTHQMSVAGPLAPCWNTSGAVYLMSIVGSYFCCSRPSPMSLAAPMSKSFRVSWSRHTCTKMLSGCVCSRLTFVCGEAHDNVRAANILHTSTSVFLQRISANIIWLGTCPTEHMAYANTSLLKLSLR